MVAERGIPMAWSPVPDLSSPGRPARAAFAVTAVIMLVQSLRSYATLNQTLGDTDDALRLRIVRDLVAGRGWFDTHLDRLQPPAGVDIHWSRLIDGGMAALNTLFGLVLAPETAEFAMRLIWPLLWVFPLTLGGLLIARRLGGSTAVMACAIFIASVPVQMQFAAGRIDHHNVQIALTMLMLAGLVHLDTKWGPWLAGIATGLVLAVGLEPLLFVAIGGMFVALRFAADDGFAPMMRRYAIGLLLSVLAAYLAQTPPRLWFASACDMLAINLLTGLIVASAGLIAASFTTRSSGLRLGAVLTAGGAALATCLALDPACLGGPYAHMDARLHAEWLDHVTEVMNWPVLFQNMPGLAAALLAPSLVAVAALLGSLRDENVRHDPAWLITGAVFAAAVFAGLFMVRILPYAAAFSALVLAGAFARHAPRKIRDTFVAAAIAAFAISPTPVALVAAVLAPDTNTADKNTNRKACTATASFTPLAGLPAGLFLADIDVGPHLIVHTHHSALAAPYHRMNEGLVTAHEIWSAEPMAAEQMLRARGVSYVMLCPARGKLPIKFPATSLRTALEHGDVPDFLEPVPAGKAFKLWKFKP
jgi:hypothetical protein